MSNISKLAARLKEQKQGDATGTGVIIDSSTLTYKGGIHSYKLAVDINTYAGKKVYCYLLATGVAVVVGD